MQFIRTLLLTLLTLSPSSATAGDLQQACSLDHAPSCYELGVFFSGHSGSRKDDTTGLKYFMKSCKLDIEGPGCDQAAAMIDENAAVLAALREGAERTKVETRTKDGRGTKVEIKKKEVDRQLAENKGVLGSLREGAELDGVFRNSKLSSDIEDSVGFLIGSGTAALTRALQNQGLPGPSSRGSELGGDGPVIIGALDKALVDAVVERHMNQIKNCYQQELTKNPKLDGKVKIKFVISKNGSVARALVESSTMNNKAVESCISGRFLRMEFPEPKGGGVVIVKYPFEFGT